MNSNDKDFLLWLAKRLVFKYKENSQIIDIVNHIISKQEALIFSNNLMIETTNNISDQIQILKQKISTNNAVVKHQRIDSTISTLEGLDFDFILESPADQKRKIQG